MKSNWISSFGLSVGGKQLISDIGICGLIDLPAILQVTHSPHSFCISFVSLATRMAWLRQTFFWLPGVLYEVE